MIGLFLGAGFSKWAADLPLVSQLFDFRISPFGPRESAKLDLVTKLKSIWDMENPNAPPERFIADALSYPARYRKAVLWYIVRRLSDPFIWTEFHSQRQRRHVLMIDEYRKYQIAGVNRAKSFLGRFGINLSGIITTNYDLLTEYALGTKEFNYGVRHQTLSGRGAYPVSQWKNPVALTGVIPLAKIHGSISWDETSYYTDGRRGLTGNALIVAPTPEKRPPSNLEIHWSLSGKILTESTRLAVFGFAFNPYDEAVLNHLKDNGQNIKSVILIDIAPNLGAAKVLWPKAEIGSTLPPPEGDQAINQWIQAGSAP
jgi:hypothetical protein